MSGGEFDYMSDRINDVADSIVNIIKKNKTLNEYGEMNNFSVATIAELKKGVEIIRLSAIYEKRIDLLVSGDNGEESFHKYLKEEVGELCKKK